MTNDIRRRPHRKKTIILIGLFIALLIASSFFVLRAGLWLVREESPRNADMIVLLMGNVPDRLLQAIELYEQGYAPLIVMVDSRHTAHEVMLARGVDIPGQAQISYAAAIELGVPEQALLILAGDAKSTQDEAVILRDHLENHPYVESILLVTSRYHSQRSAVIFERALGDSITVTSCPSIYDPFNERRWWRSRQDAKSVLTEYLKFIHFYAFERFSLHP